MDKQKLNKQQIRQIMDSCVRKKQELNNLASQNRLPLSNDLNNQTSKRVKPEFTNDGFRNREEEMNTRTQFVEANRKNETPQRDLEEKEVKQKNIYFILAFLLGLFASFILWHFLTKGQEETQKELRLMLVGKTGAGKSAAGNTILGGESFRVEASPGSLTNSCDSVTKVMEGMRVTVIDTPGVNDTWLLSVPTGQSPYDCISSIALRPHVFLMVVRLGRYTEEERKSVKWIQEKFGEAANKFTIVLFTGGDLLGGKPIEKFISQSVDLTTLVKMCEGGYHVFNNNDKGNRNQVTELFEKIKKILNQNFGYNYAKEIYEKVEQETRDAAERKMEEMENMRNLQVKKKIDEMTLKLRDEQHEKLKLQRNLNEAGTWTTVAVVSIIILLVFLGCALNK